MDETTTTVYSGSASGLVSQSVYRISYWDLSLPFSCIGIVQNVAPGCLMMAAYGMGPRPVPPLHSTRTSVNRTSNMDSMDCIGGLVASEAGCCCSNEPGRARAQPRPQARQEYNQGRRRGSRVVPVTRGDPGWPGHPHAGWQSTRSPQVLKIGRMLWNIVIWFSQSNIFMVPPLLNIHYQTTFILLGFEETSTI